MKADKKKLDSDISYLCAYSDDLQTIIYEKDDNLYVVKDLGEKEKIASDVDGVNVHDINGNFQIYYVKESDETSLSAYDLIKDDYLSQDQNITEPRLEDYQTVTYVDDFFSSREKIETDDAYYQDVEKLSSPYPEHITYYHHHYFSKEYIFHHRILSSRLRQKLSLQNHSRHTDTIYDRHNPLYRRSCYYQ